MNGNEYDMAYFLTDNIYPKWRIFMRTFKGDQRNMMKAFANYARRHEAIRKDIERLFGVLQKRFHVLFHPCRSWSKEMMSIVVAACITLHNMIVEDEFDDGLLDETDYEWKKNRVEKACLSISEPLAVADSADHDPSNDESTFDQEAFASRFHAIQDEEDHRQLQMDLINHLWTLKSQEC